MKLISGIGALLVLLALAGSNLAQVSRDFPGIQAVPVFRPAQQEPNPSAVKVARLHYSGGGDWYWGARRYRISFAISGRTLIS